MLEQKRLHVPHAVCHFRPKSHQSPGLARFVRRLRFVLLQIGTGDIDHVIDLIAQHAANGFVQQASGFVGFRQTWMLLQCECFVVCKQRHFGHLRQGQQTRAHTVIDVMSVVRDGIGQIAQLRF